MEYSALLFHPVIPSDAKELYKMGPHWLAAAGGDEYRKRLGMDCPNAIRNSGCRNNCRSKAKNDYSSATLKNIKRWMTALCYEDIKGFQDAVHLLHTDVMQNKVPNLVCDFGRQFFSIKNEPTPKSEKMLLGAIKRHSSLWELAKLGFKARKSL